MHPWLLSKKKKKHPWAMAMSCMHIHLYFPLAFSMHIRLVLEFCGNKHLACNLALNNLFIEEIFLCVIEICCAEHSSCSWPSHHETSTTEPRNQEPSPVNSPVALLVVASLARSFFFSSLPVPNPPTLTA